MTFIFVCIGLLLFFIMFVFIGIALIPSKMMIESKKLDVMQNNFDYVKNQYDYNVHESYFNKENEMKTIFITQPLASKPMPEKRNRNKLFNIMHYSEDSSINTHHQHLLDDNNDDSNNENT